MNHNHDKMTVADVMRVAVQSVPSKMTLPDLEDQLLQSKVGGFPVVDDNKLVGVISRSDIVRQLSLERDVAEHTSDFYFDDHGFHEQRMESFKDIAERIGNRIEGLIVRDVMVKNPLTVAMDQTISDAAKRFVKHHVHRLPVTDRGTLVGIVTTIDLVQLIADRRLK